MRTETRFVEDEIKGVCDQFEKQFEGVVPGEVILVSHGDELALIRYEKHGPEIEKDGRHRLHRGMYLVDSGSMLDSLHGRPYRPRATDRLKGNVFGSACLRFVFDPEFNAYWPTAWHKDIFVRMATRYPNGRVITAPGSVQVTRGKEAICAKLLEVVRLNYLRRVVIPFIEGEMTDYKPPGWGFKAWLMLIPGLQWAYANVAEKLDAGDFIYVGCKEEVFLLSVAKESKDAPLFWQGTYTASSKPPLYFTNARLDHNDARSDTFVGEMFGRGLIRTLSQRYTCKEREVREATFICPQMGRRQNCKYTIFSGQPELITGDLEAALKHFATTDFADYSDVVKKYAEQIRVPHPTAEPCSTGGFFI